MREQDPMVIVGAGQAGGWAAKTLRAEGYAGRIVLVGAERHPAYERPPLSKAVLSGEAAPETTYLFKSAEHAELDLDFRPETRVLRIDRAAKQVDLSGGERIGYDKLLEVFWRSHDPTTLNRQGNDVRTQYRSAIFYHTDRQRDLAERYKRKVDEAGVFASPVVTEITPAATFYPAEAYHQNFFNDNPRQPYCRAVVGPKVEKLRQVFKGRLLAE